MPTLSPHSQTPSLTYVVSGMTCSHCEAAVTDEAGYDAVAA